MHFIPQARFVASLLIGTAISSSVMMAADDDTDMLSLTTPSYHQRTRHQARPARARPTPISVPSKQESKLEAQLRLFATKIESLRVLQQAMQESEQKRLEAISRTQNRAEKSAEIAQEAANEAIEAEGRAAVHVSNAQQFLVAVKETVDVLNVTNLLGDLQKQVKGLQERADGHENRLLKLEALLPHDEFDARRPRKDDDDSLQALPIPGSASPASADSDSPLSLWSARIESPASSVTSASGDDEESLFTPRTPESPPLTRRVRAARITPQRPTTFNNEPLSFDLFGDILSARSLPASPANESAEDSDFSMTPRVRSVRMTPTRPLRTSTTINLGHLFEQSLPRLASMHTSVNALSHLLVPVMETPVIEDSVGSARPAAAAPAEPTSPVASAVLNVEFAPASLDIDDAAPEDVVDEAATPSQPAASPPVPRVESAPADDALAEAVPAAAPSQPASPAIAAMAPNVEPIPAPLDALAEAVPAAAPSQPASPAIAAMAPNVEPIPAPLDAGGSADIAEAEALVAALMPATALNLGAPARALEEDDDKISITSSDVDLADVADLDSNAETEATAASASPVAASLEPDMDVLAALLKDTLPQLGTKTTLDLLRANAAALPRATSPHTVADSDGWDLLDGGSPRQSPTSAYERSFLNGTHAAAAAVEDTASAPAPAPTAAGGIFANVFGNFFS